MKILEFEEYLKTAREIKVLWAFGEPPTKLNEENLELKLMRIINVADAYEFGLSEKKGNLSSFWRRLLHSRKIFPVASKTYQLLLLCQPRGKSLSDWPELGELLDAFGMQNSLRLPPAWNALQRYGFKPTLYRQDLGIRIPYFAKTRNSRVGLFAKETLRDYLF